MAVVRVLLITVLALAVAGPGHAGSGPSFPDPVGDSDGAPDVQTVRISSTARSVEFAIETAGGNAWAGAAAILNIDADANPATGDAGGTRGYELSYVLHSEHTEFTLDKSNGVHIAHPAATWALRGPTLTISVPFSELGSRPRIGFRIETLSSSGSDSAPDRGAADWQFSPNAPVTALAARFSRAAPQHGKRFTVTRVTTSFADGNHGVSAFSCTARIGSLSLRGSCSWLVPASAAGRTLSVRVTAAGRTRLYRFRVH